MSTENPKYEAPNSFAYYFIMLGFVMTFVWLCLVDENDFTPSLIRTMIENTDYYGSNMFSNMMIQKLKDNGRVTWSDIGGMIIQNFDVPSLILTYYIIACLIVNPVLLYNAYAGHIRITLWNHLYAFIAINCVIIVAMFVCGLLGFIGIQAKINKANRVYTMSGKIEV
jgi:hypothetical protein